MPNKRYTNSCNTTGQHRTQPLAKPRLSSCSTATTQCAFQSYRSRYMTPKYANEMHKPKQSKRLTRIPKRMLSTTTYRSMTRSCCFNASPRPSQGMTQSHSKLLKYKVPRSQLHMATKYEKEMPRILRKFTHPHPQTIEGTDIR